MPARLIAILGVALAVVATDPAAAQGPSRAGAPEAVAVERAMDTLRADPHLAAEARIWTLRWQQGEQKKSLESPWWLWISRLFAWLAQSTRVLVWFALGLLAVLMVRYVSGSARRYRSAATDPGFETPTHIRELDIRPESLPADIGGAARHLWDTGSERDALAMLYRGLLSRLAHVHRVPIRESSTEGDCLALADDHAPPIAGGYASRLVPIWQRFVYGGVAASTASVHSLCDDFAAALDGSEPARVTNGGVA